jgi:hypothetical protein
MSRFRRRVRIDRDHRVGIADAGCRKSALLNDSITLTIIDEISCAKRVIRAFKAHPQTEVASLSSAIDDLPFRSAAGVSDEIKRGIRCMSSPAKQAEGVLTPGAPTGRRYHFFRHLPQNWPPQSGA